jgi:hypothetical protein
MTIGSGTAIKVKYYQGQSRSEYIEQDRLRDRIKEHPIFAKMAVAHQDSHRRTSERARTYLLAHLEDARKRGDARHKGA